MPYVFFPQEEMYEKLKGLLHGFLIDEEEDGRIALLIKLDASLLASIISGCVIEIVLRNPNIAVRTCTLYIYDIPTNPHCITAKNLSDEDKTAKGFDEIVVKLLTKRQIRVALYNEFSHPIFTTFVELDYRADEFGSWLLKVQNHDEFKNVPKDTLGIYFPENERTGFRIKVLNKDNSREKKPIIISPDYEYEVQSEAIMKQGAFDYDDYVGDGKHGYLQEVSIVNNFLRLLKPNVEFFVSPKQTDGTEFADFLVIYKNACIVIESKYVISDSKRNRTKAIKKAIDQLNRAEKLVINKEASLADDALAKLLDRVNFVVKICLVNDKIIIDEANSRNIIQQYPKEELPLFISVSGFFLVLTELRLKNEEQFMFNIVYNFGQWYHNFIHGRERILYIDLALIKPGWEGEG